MSREDKARDIVAKSLASLIRRREIDEDAEKFFEKNRDLIAQEVFSTRSVYELDQDDIEFLSEISAQYVDVDNSESSIELDPDLTYAPKKSLGDRLEELGRGIITTIEIAVSEWEAKIGGSNLATGFRRSQVSRADENLAKENQSAEIVEVVNWVPGEVASTIVGCQISLVWKDRGAPPSSPNLMVFYDEESATFEAKFKDASTIEISIDQPKPSRFVIDVSDARAYVIKLYSS